MLLIQKIFGYGPDTFGIVTKANNYPEMFDRYYETFDSAHNEYLQYLVTIGPFGLLAYLGIHGSIIYQDWISLCAWPRCSRFCAMPFRRRSTSTSLSRLR